MSRVRKDALIALGKIGPAAEAAIPALTVMQDEGVDEYYVNQALKEIRGDPPGSSGQHAAGSQFGRI